MRVRNSRRTALVVLSLLFALGLSACSDDKESTTEATGSPSVDVTMADYAFSVSGPLTAGGTIKLSNKGQEFHVMFLAKLKEGKSLADVQTALQQMGEQQGGEQQPSTTAAQSTTTAAQSAATQPQGEGGEEDQNPFADIADDIGPPGGFMGPGQAVDVTVPSMDAGTYAMVCFVPTEGEGLPHFAKGMINQLQVVEGTAPPAPTADATYKLAAGKAIEGPAQLSAGTRTLKFEAASGSDQLEPILAKLNPGATLTQLDEAASKLFESEAPPPKNAAATLPGQVVYASVDLGEITTFYVATNFSAGSYAISAEDTDTENRPKPAKEVIEITVT